MAINGKSANLAPNSQAWVMELERLIKKLMAENALQATQIKNLQTRVK